MLIFTCDLRKSNNEIEFILKIAKTKSGKDMAKQTSSLISGDIKKCKLEIYVKSLKGIIYPVIYL